MLQPEMILAALKQKQALFHEAQLRLRADVNRLHRALAEWATRPASDIEATLQDVPWPGARPTIEQDTQPLIIPFSQQWSNHRQARAWALKTLEGVTTFAADGSQILVTGDLSVPVGLVQIGWFENNHVNDGQGRFEKDIEVEVLVPTELGGIEATSIDNNVDWQRFYGELARIEKFMDKHPDRQRRAVAFFDGSLIVSFIQHMREPRQKAYIGQIEHLLDVSERTGVPLVAYIAASRADDLSSMIGRLGGLEERGRVSDAQLLHAKMAGWGSRCRFYRCARDDRVVSVNGHKYYPRVLMTYLQMSTDKPPVRLELPDWVLASGQHEWVLDVVRAECVVGIGYPYALETADAVAVLTAPDRERFLAIFQQFAAEMQLALSFSDKELSKRRRR